MNRTAALLSLATGLVLVALVVATPSPSPSPPPADPPKVAVPKVTLPPAPPAVTGDGALRLDGRLSHPLVGTGSQDVFVTVDVTGRALPGTERSKVNLALVIDRSGSMAGQKLEQAKSAARGLVAQLTSTDQLTLIHYGSDVRALPPLHATEENRRRMLRFIDGIVDDGGTNIGAGLRTGRTYLASGRSDFEVNRLILISDGQPTEGITHAPALLGLAGELRAEGVTVSAIGVGVDFNENLMQGIAERGAGAYAYLRDGSGLATLFQKDLQQAGTMVARNVELSFELPAGVALGEVLGYAHSQAGRTVRVPLPDFSAGQLERVVVHLHISAAGAAGSSVEVSGLSLRYDDLLADGPGEARTALTALVGEDPEGIAQAQDKEVALFAARAQAAVNVTRAAERLAKGDHAGADVLIQENSSLFDRAGAVAGSGAVAEDVAAQHALRESFAGARSAPEVQHEVKAAKQKARRDFGRLGSTW